MIANNFKNLFFHGIWYCFIAFLIFSGFMNKYINELLGSELLSYLVIIFISLLYSAIIFGVFIKPTGKMSTDISSNGTLISMNTLIICGTFIITLFKRLKFEIFAIISIGLLAQFIILLMIMAFKNEEEQN